MNISNSGRKSKSQCKYVLREKSADFLHEFAYITVLGKKMGKTSISFETSFFPYPSKYAL